MAKYEDYVKTGELENEIADASANQRERDEKGRFIPDRFKGKDMTDVIKSYEELEKLNSRQAQDLGAMRKQVDELLEITQNASSPTQEPSKPVSVDDLYEDADGVLRRVVREESSGEIAKLQKELEAMRLERKLGRLEDKFPNWREKAQTPEFLEWVKESPYRVRMVQDADAGDFDAAEEVLGMYYELESEAPAVDEEKQTAALRDGMLESPSPAPTELVDTYSRNDLLEVRLASKRGDLKAQRWLAAHSDSIAKAYEEGRIVD